MKNSQHALFLCPHPHPCFYMALCDRGRNHELIMHPDQDTREGSDSVVGLSRWRSTLTFFPFVQFKILCCRFPWIHFSFSFFMPCTFFLEDIMPCTLYFSYPFPATPLNWRNGIYLHFHVRCRHIGERTRNQTV